MSFCHLWRCLLQSRAPQCQNIWKGVSLDNQVVFGIHDLLVVFAGGHGEVVAAVERTAETHLRSAEPSLARKEAGVKFHAYSHGHRRCTVAW
jgi:hypothetical protein